MELTNDNPHLKKTKIESEPLKTKLFHESSWLLKGKRKMNSKRGRKENYLA